MTTTADASQWRRTSPFAVLFFLGRLIRGIIKNATQALAPVAAAIFALDGSLTDRIGLAVGAGVILAIAVSVLRYLFFRFQVTEDSVLIREGIFQKKQLDIRFNRIQGVNIEQNFVSKRLGLVNMKFDTAGSSSDEGVLPAVKEDYADELQSRIDGAVTEISEQPEKPASLLTLGFRDMVRIGLSDGRALLILAILGPLIEQSGDRVERLVYNAAASGFERLQAMGFLGGLIIALTIMLLVAALLALGSIVAAFLRYHDFQLTLDGPRLRTEGGLLTRHRASMRLRKIQRVRMRQNLMLRFFGRYRLTVQQVSSSGSKGESNSIVVPLLTEDFGNALSGKLFAPEADGLSMHPDDPRFLRVSRGFIRSRTVLIGCLPLLPAATPLIMSVGPYAAFALVWPLLAYFAVRRYWRRLGYYVLDDVMVRRRGLLSYGLDAFLLRKVQRVSISQSLWQRRKDHATLEIYLASGTIRLPYLKIADAQQLRDFLLYKVESDPRAWH